MIEESLWDELERGADERAGELRRRLLPSSRHEVFAVLLLPSRERQLALKVSVDHVRDLALEQSHVVKLEFVNSDSGGSKELRFRLLTGDAEGVFTAFCGDLVSQLLTVRAADAGFDVIYSRYLLWRRLLGPAAREGLSRPQQQGLFGELMMLKELLEKNRHLEVISAWQGPFSSTTDFIHSSHGLEVKTVASHAPGVVRISSESQLSLVGLATLRLCIYSLVVRQNGSGDSLPELISNIRAVLAGVSRTEFERRLIASGYHDVHRELYVGTKYSVIGRESFVVSERFPSLRREELPDGVGNVSYDLSLDACESFREKINESFSDILGDLT